MCEIAIYTENERNVVTQRFRTPASQIGPNWPKFADEVRKQNVFISGWGIAEYHVPGEYNPDDVDYELMLPVMGEISPSAPLAAKKLEAAKVASILHRGEHETMCETYDKLFKWIAEQGLQVAGNVREVYLRCPHTNNDPAGYVTEILVPVK